MIRILQISLYLGMATLATSGAGREDVRLNPPEHSAPAMGSEAQTLSVMTYNVKGLPWPIAQGRSEALRQIAVRFRTLRRAGRQPRVILLQEAFSAEAALLATGAGYPYVVSGPDTDFRTPATIDKGDAEYLKQIRWDRGEQIGKQLDSGLIILSDYPIIRADRMAFPDFACAGFDCLANKGVLIAHLDVPGSGPVSIVNAHLNARRAAGVPVGRSQRAYERQVDLMARFVARHAPRSRPLILGGDMNVGHDPDRRQAFFGGFTRLGLRFVTPGFSGAQQALDRGAATGAGVRDDLALAARHAKDWLFARDADGAAMQVVRAEVPFGSEGQGEPLSDHFGYVIHYAAQRRAPHEAVHFANASLPVRAGQR